MKFSSRISSARRRGAGQTRRGCFIGPPKDRLGCAPWKGGAFQWVQIPPGKSLQPEATGAVMEVTKWLKPSECGSRTGDRASVQAATRVNAEQASHDGRVVKQYVLSFLEASRRRDGRWRNSSLYRALCVGGDLFSYPVLRYETQ